MNVDEAWEATLSQWDNRLLTDNPQCKTIFANGAGFVLMRLRENWSKKEIARLYDEFETFVDAYMAESDAAAARMRRS